MSSVLFVAPLLAAHWFAPAETREVHASGVVVRAVATDGRDGASARLEVRAHGRSQTITLEHREISAARLLASIEIVDANFDGQLDVVVLREFGAKWGASDVFVFDARTQRFTDALPIARALSRLSNATFDGAARVVTTHDIGPSNPSRVTYAIDGPSLREVASCRFLNGGLPHAGARVGTLVQSRAGKTTYKTVRLSAFDIDPCNP